MRTSIYVLFFGLILTFSCETKGPSECYPPPCPRPNVNLQARLTLNFEQLKNQDLSHIQIIRINKDDNSVIDTVNFDMSQSLNKQVPIGGGGSIGFSEPVTGSAIVEGNLNFRILINESSDSYDISNIEFEDTNTEKCVCPDYQIKALQLDTTTITINSSYYVLTLN